MTKEYQAVLDDTESSIVDWYKKHFAIILQALQAGAEGRILPKCDNIHSLTFTHGQCFIEFVNGDQTDGNSNTYAEAMQNAIDKIVGAV